MGSENIKNTDVVKKIADELGAVMRGEAPKKSPEELDLIPIMTDAELNRTPLSAAEGEAQELERARRERVAKRTK